MDAEARSDESRSWSCRKELVGGQRADGDRWHCKWRLATGDKPKNWRRTAFSRKTLRSAKGLVAWNSVVCPRESWMLRE